MNKRVEPRFKTDTGVTLQLPNQAQPCPARMVDVSGVGFRLLVEQPIAVGEVLQINVEDRRLLVTVRHCGPAENGYFVGVERIDKWLPGEAPEEAAVLGRPQLKKDVDPLRVIGLRNQFSKPSAGTGKDRRGMMLGGIAAVIGLSVLALIWGGMRGSGHTAATPPVVEKPVAKTEPASAAPVKKVVKKAAAPAPAPVAKPALASSKPEAVAHAAAPAVASTAKPAPVAGPLQVTLRASELSWVDACADGRVVFAKAFNA
ncbi:MAG TPA: PilZ domain-containing protein, partial [Bryobacteraceae bacterium]|nr:PilZ domain-containing protein [Bryobacteraceae bacterium]